MNLGKSIALILATAKFTECLSIFNILGYLPQTLLHFGVNKDDIGAYVGLITNINLTGRFFGYLVYGPVLDRWDTVKVLAFMQYITALCTLGLALSVNPASLAVFQFLIGFANGVDMALRVLFRDIKLDSYDLSFVYAVPISVALSVGPSVSGILALPTEQYPAVFGDSYILGLMPVFVPNLVLSICFFCNGVAVMKFLPKFSSIETVDLMDSSSDISEPNESKTDCHYQTKHVKHDCLKILSDQCKETWFPYLAKVFRMDFFICCIAVNLFWSSSVVFYVIFTLWIGTPLSMAGMGFTPAETTKIYFVPGLIAVLLDIVVLGRINASMSAKRGFAFWALLKSFAICTIICFSALRDQTLFSIGAGLALTLIRFATSGCNATSVDFINQTVPREVLGIANGLAISTASLLSTASAVALGKVYSWSIVNQLNSEDGKSVFPFNRYFTFYVSGLMATLSAIFSAFVNRYSY